MSDEIECVVIGAGVVGLAVARQLALSGVETIVLEAADAIGTETSSRNSEVIHAGIYYPEGSLKARMCVQGRHMLYRFCQDHGVTYNRCGKLVVATTENELERLREIQSAAQTNGVSDIVWLTREEAIALEPELNCVAALHSPSTGIVDSHSYMLALQGDFEDAGGVIAFHSRVSNLQISDGRFEVTVREANSDQPVHLSSRYVINAAGLYAVNIARRIEGFPEESIPPFYMTKGNYFRLNRQSPFSRLIYPIPPKGGLGTHITIDLGGGAKFGPDIEAIDEIDYTVDPRRADIFYAAIRTYWPKLPDDSLSPDYAGIRPKVEMPGDAPQDFIIRDPDDHKIPGLINLFGIESPGLTASLALAEDVHKRLIRN